MQFRKIKKMNNKTYEEKIEVLVSTVKKKIDEMSSEDREKHKDLFNALMSIGNRQAEEMDSLFKDLGLEHHSMAAAKKEIKHWKRKANHEDGDEMRKKFNERVEYTACETRDVDTEPNKLVMWNAPNGDLYMSICPQSHRMGISIRFERSGGCSTKNPDLLTAMMDAYDAIAGNFK